MRATRGFTLLELLVVVTIISILTIVVTYNLQAQGASSRDAQRQADLRTLQNAIELYKNRYGEYPAGCRGTGFGVWSGEPGTGMECPDGDPEYIVGLVPEFIRSLPTDPNPRLRDSFPNAGYGYVVDPQRQVYKLVAFRTMETEVTLDTEFPICDSSGNRSDATLYCVEVDGGPEPAHCDPNEDQFYPVFNTSIAVWGGTYVGSTDVDDYVERIVCDIP
mgnify:CR=1 FL=1